MFTYCGWFYGVCCLGVIALVFWVLIAWSVWLLCVYSGAFRVLGVSGCFGLVCWFFMVFLVACCCGFDWFGLIYVGRLIVLFIVHAVVGLRFGFLYLVVFVVSC